MMNKLESFIYACLPALLILTFSEVAVYLANGDIGVTMSILGIFYLVLIWWLYQYTRVKNGENDVGVENIETPVVVPTHPQRKLEEFTAQSDDEDIPSEEEEE